ncbi:hypothetical protein MRB53_016765 [Persea americana]|uniref:Uncharacterized protein n=1 Tax=Persea americana TaxID=3435 RepID=A0ACC2M411_PERAE|nr:hypothetical protein MRB53_016765 [Persea americana]
MPSSNFSVFNVSIAVDVAGTNLNPICSCNNSDSRSIKSNINDSSNSPDMLSNIRDGGIASNVLGSRNRLVALKCDGMVKALNTSDSSDHLDIVAVEAIPDDHIDPCLVQKGLAEFTEKLSLASTDLEKAAAQIAVDVHSALNSAIAG